MSEQQDSGSAIPAMLFAEKRAGLSSSHLPGGVWSGLNLSGTYTPYVRADLVRQLQEALQATLDFAAALEKYHGRGVGSRRGGPVFERARAALAKLKEAGL